MRLETDSNARVIDSIAFAIKGRYKATMTDTRFLFAAILIAAEIVSGHPLSNKDQPKRWRKWYDRLYSEAPLKGRPQVVPDVSLQVAERAINKLFAIFKESGSRLRGVPQSEQEEIAFWLRATSFSAEDCKISREFSFLRHYAKDLDTSHMERPLLKAHMNLLKQQLLEYCISTQSGPIAAATDMGHRDRRMVSAIGTKGDPVAVDYDRLKMFLLFVQAHDAESHDPSVRETSTMRTRRLYQTSIGSACERIKSLPEPARDAILYLEHNKVLDRVTPRAREWLRLVRICDLAANNMQKLYQVMNDAIIGERYITSSSSAASNLGASSSSSSSGSSSSTSSNSSGGGSSSSCAAV